MTPAERRKPDLLNGKRRARIARGSGVEVSEVNKLIKMHRTMADVAKAMGKGKLPGGLGAMAGMGGGMPNPEALKQLGAGKPLPGLPGLTGQNGLPGLPGLPGSNKKS